MTLPKPAIGHNTGDVRLRIEARFFNTLARYAADGLQPRHLELAAGATLGDLVAHIGIPIHDIFLALRNGRDVSPGIYAGGQINLDAALEDGDVIAFSGPVPYSFGYGAPIV